MGRHRSGNDTRRGGAVIAKLGVAAVLAALTVCAFQSALTPAGWTDTQANAMAKSFFSNSHANLTFFLGYVTKPVKENLRTKPPAERAQIVKNLALHAKKMVQSPGFGQLHTAWIRESLNAVDHGIKVEPNAAPAEPSMNAALGQMAAGLTEGLKNVAPEGLKMMLDAEVQSLSGSRSADDRKRLDQVRQMQGMIPGRIDDAKKQYIAYMVAKLGGPSDEASIQASLKLAAKSQVDQKRMEQQLNYNKYNLKATLRDRLTVFLNEAKSVDFNAQTRPLAGRDVFVNPGYESKPGSWKLLWRMGREPVMAAVEVAQAWTREL